ncbi:MAG: MraY family glycosyltransferase, partial [Alphaproteobacteria bacterium]
LGLVDTPQGRKNHIRSTPVVGGLAILLGATFAIIGGMVFREHAVVIADVALEHVGYFIGAGLLVVLGAMDDRKPVAARYKLLVQLAACVIASLVDGLQIHDFPIGFGAWQVTLGPLVIPFTVLVMLTITNAINMIDGVDGLAGGITLMGFLIMAKALVTAGFPTAPYLIALVAAMAAFLVFNFPLLPNRPAKVFLGDAGSLVCGFTLAYLAIDLSSLPNRVFKPSTALWFFFIPVADTVWLYVRRAIAARAPFWAGRDHIHHLLMEHMSARAVAWLLVTASGLMAAGGYLAERRHVPGILLIGLWTLAFMIYGALTQKAWRRAWDRGLAERGTH